MLASTATIAPATAAICAPLVKANTTPIAAATPPTHTMVSYMFVTGAHPVIDDRHANAPACATIAHPIEMMPSHPMVARLRLIADKANPARDNPYIKPTH